MGASSNAFIPASFMERVVCQFPARLHFGLLDMNGSLGRVDGGIGLAIAQPATVVEAVRADAVRVRGDMEASLRARLRQGLPIVCARLGLPGAQVTVRQAPPPHSGFGSATQTLVGAAKTVALLAGRPLPARQLARLMGRGGTSGIGSAVIDGGGFIVDGGHAFRQGRDAKERFAPSGASETFSPPPVLMQRPFPAQWRILVCCPQGLDISGKQETDLFAQVCPVPDDEVARMSRILLSQILPALAEEDLDAFGRGLEAYQGLGFKRAEIRSQTPTVRACMERLRARGGQGVGMSSWGPTVFALGQDLAALQRDMQAWLQARGGGEAFVTAADNVGHRLLL